MTYLALVNVAALLLVAAALVRMLLVRADREPYGRAALLLLGVILMLGLAGLSRRIDFSQADVTAAIAWTITAATALTIAVWRLTPHD